MQRSLHLVMCPDHAAMRLPPSVLPYSEQKNRDKYGRIVGVCSIPEGAGRQDLNAWMVQEGYAVAYRCETAAAACTVVTTGLPAWAGAGGLRTGVQVRGCGCCGLPLLAW